DKIVYQDRVVEVPVERVMYKPPPVPVERVVYKPPPRDAVTRGESGAYSSSAAYGASYAGSASYAGASY
ncbi:hypothetical protein T484DRAFT_1831295, partial [Baffinella frigidus]